MSLKLSHAFMDVADLEKVTPFYTKILGFKITDRGRINGEIEAVFMSQDPENHHQIALAETLQAIEPNNKLSHVAFRMDSLDELRTLKKRLNTEGVAINRELSHGNAWSLYFSDPEGNGVECFVDTPFHVSQPQGKPTNIDLADKDLLAKTRDDFSQEPDFSPYADWQEKMRRNLKN